MRTFYADSRVYVNNSKVQVSGPTSTIEYNTRYTKSTFSRLADKRGSSREMCFSEQPIGLKV